MAKRQRDYQAEYRRRLEKAREKGLTTAQARRGAKKYATQAPREHERRKAATQARHGLSPGQVTRVRRQHRAAPGKHGHRDLSFPDLDSALRYARDELAPGEVSMIKGYGRFAADKNYDLVTKSGKGYASLATMSMPSGYTPARTAAIEAKGDEVFSQLDRVHLVVRDFAG